MSISEPRDPDYFAARLELERARIIEEYWQEYWRGVRRRASLLVAVFVPATAALLVASFLFLTRARLTSAAAVYADAVLGGLLGAVLVCVPKLTALTRVGRSVGDHSVERPFFGVVLPQLALGFVAGSLEASLVLGFTDQDSYKPQTVYLLAVALAIAFSRVVKARIAYVAEFEQRDE